MTEDKATYNKEKNRYPTFRYKEQRNGKKVYIDIAYLPDLSQIHSIFISGSKDGTDMRFYEMEAGILLSDAIRGGIDPEQLLNTLPSEGLASFALNVALGGEIELIN